MELIHNEAILDKKLLLRLYQDDEYVIEVNKQIGEDIINEKNVDEVYEKFIRAGAKFLFSEYLGLPNGNEIINRPLMAFNDKKQKIDMCWNIINNVGCFFTSYVGYTNQSLDIINRFSEPYRKLFKIFDASKRLKQDFYGFTNFAKSFAYAYDDKVYEPSFILVGLSDDVNLKEIVIPKTVKKDAVIPYLRIYATSRHLHFIRLIEHLIAKQLVDKYLKDKTLEEVILITINVLSSYEDKETKFPIVAKLEGGLGIYDIREFIMYHKPVDEILESLDKLIRVFRENASSAVIYRRSHLPALDILVEVKNIPIRFVNDLLTFIKTLSAIVPYDKDDMKAVERLKDEILI